MKAKSRTEKLKSMNLYEELIKLRDAQREKKKKSIFLVRGDELPWEINPQGKMRWYLHPSMKEAIWQ